MHTVFQIWQSTDSTAQRVGSWSPAYRKPTSEFKATTVRNLFPYANICRLPAARDPHPTASIKITRCEEYDDRVQRHLCSVPPMNCNSSNPPPSYTLLDVAPPAPASRKRIGTLDGHNRIISAESDTSLRPNARDRPHIFPKHPLRSHNGTLLGATSTVRGMSAL